MPASLPQAPVELPESASWAYKPIIGPLSPTDIMAIAGAALGPLSVGGVGSYKYKPFLPLSALGNVLEGKQGQYGQQVLAQQQAAQAAAAINPFLKNVTGLEIPSTTPTGVIHELVPLINAQIAQQTALRKPVVTKPNEQIVDPVTRQPIYTTPPAPRPSIEEIRAEADAKRRTLEEELRLRRESQQPPRPQLYPGDVNTPPRFVDPTTGTYRPLTGPSGAPLPPKAEKPTETQSKAVAFGLRAKNATRTLDRLENSGYMGSELQREDMFAESFGIPRINIFGIDTPEVKPFRALGFVSRVGQLYNQAKREFITAMLRKDSGATITASELDQAERTYFPVFGDKREVIEQKARAREQVIAGLLAEAGRGAASLQAPPLTPPASPPSGAQDTLNPTIPGVGKVLYVGEKEGLKVYQDPKTGYQFSQLPNGDWHKLKESEQFGGPP